LHPKEELMKVILAEKQEITKAGIRFLSQQIKEIDEIVEVNDKKQLIQELINSPLAIVILDYTLFDLSSADELIILHERFPPIQWILFSENLNDSFIKKVVYYSERFSIVLKDCDLNEIRSALQKGLHLERFICQEIMNMLLTRTPYQEELKVEALTATEKEILCAIAQGKTTKIIAAEHFSSVHTVTTHRKNIFRKLHVHNLHEAIKYAFRSGLIDAAEFYI